MRSRFAWTRRREPRWWSRAVARPLSSPSGAWRSRDGRVHELAQGDAVTFDADLPHRFENAGEGQASFLAVVAAGLRRS